MRRVLVTTVLFASLSSVAAPATAATISFPSATITNANPFGIDIQLANVDFLYSFAFNLVYDPTVIEFVSAQEGAFLADTPIPPAAPPNLTVFGSDGTVPGIVSIFNVLIGAPQGASGSGSLATVTFRPLRNGNPAITLQALDFIGLPPVLPCDDEFDDCPSGFVPIAVNATPGQIVIRQTTPVPEPATLTLFGLGLLGLARRRAR